MSTSEFVLYTTHQGSAEARVGGVVIPIVNRRLSGRWIARSPKGAEIDVTHIHHNTPALERALRDLLATETEGEKA
jgi:hypothetical protein